jgi:hypothetical protein
MEGDMVAADLGENIGHALRLMFIMAGVAFLCCAFLAITFLQSSINKIRDYKGNRNYFQSQFAASPLKNFTGFLLPLLLILELASGLLSVFAMIDVLFFGHTITMAFACGISALTLLCLLFGQRVANDYAGAASLTGYFLVAIAGMIGTAFCG